MTQDHEVWYRFEDSDNWEGTAPSYQKRELTVTRKTPKGVWLDNWGVGKFVLTDARKRFAYPTVELAFDSYVRRKENQKSRLESQLNAVKERLEQVKEGVVGELSRRFK